MNATDPRKFKYPIEPIRQRQIWQLDVQQARLAKVNRESNAAREQLERLQRVLAEQVAQASLSWRQKPDPQSRGNVLAYLTQSQAMIEQATSKLEAIRARQKEARQACEECQRQLELTESHRQSSLRIHTTKEQQILATQADDEWITRQLWLSNEADPV